MHITKQFKINGKHISPLKDPWISTTSDYTTFKGSKHTTTIGRIYKIETTFGEVQFVDPADLDFGSGRGPSHSKEKEFPAFYLIPWTNVMGWYIEKTGVYKPNKRYGGACVETRALKKRTLGAACAMRQPGAKPASPVPSPGTTWRQGPAPAGIASKPKVAPASGTKATTTPAKQKTASRQGAKPSGAPGRKFGRRAFPFEW